MNVSLSPELVEGCYFLCLSAYGGCQDKKVNGELPSLVNQPLKQLVAGQAINNGGASRYKWNADFHD